MKKITLYILFLVYILSVKTAMAALPTKCKLQNQPCNEQGHRFLCARPGWGGPSFCSENDLTEPGPFPFPNASSSYGYCVPKGKAVKANNAILIIENQYVNGRRRLRPDGHSFFTRNGPNEIGFYDWGGQMRLIKVPSDHSLYIEAEYENSSHNQSNDVIHKQQVLCVSSSPQHLDSVSCEKIRHKSCYL